MKTNISSPTNIDRHRRQASAAVLA